MTNPYFYLFLIGALFPGFILFHFFKDAYDEYKHTGVFSMETLIGSPMLFFFSLAAFLGMSFLAVQSLMAS